MLHRLSLWLWSILVFAVRAARTFAVAAAVWFGPAAGAIYDRVNWTEFFRVLILASSSGTLVQAVQLVISNMTTILVDPSLAPAISAVVSVVIGLLEYMRRRRQGVKLVQQ